MHTLLPRRDERRADARRRTAVTYAYSYFSLRRALSLHYPLLFTRLLFALPKKETLLDSLLSTLVPRRADNAGNTRKKTPALSAHHLSDRRRVAVYSTFHFSSTQLPAVRGSTFPLLDAPSQVAVCSTPLFTSGANPRRPPSTAHPRRLVHLAAYHTRRQDATPKTPRRHTQDASCTRTPKTPHPRRPAHPGTS